MYHRKVSIASSIALPDRMIMRALEMRWIPLPGKNYDVFHIVDMPICIVRSCREMPVAFYVRLYNLFLSTTAFLDHMGTNSRLSSARNGFAGVSILNFLTISG